MMECGSCATLYSSVPQPRTQPGIVIQDRDYAVLSGLFESRIMTRQHIAVLYFDGKAEATKKRIQKYIAARLIDERNRQPNEPAVLSISKRGFDTLAETGMLSEYPQQDWRSCEKRIKVSESTIRHELEVMDVKAIFTSVIRDRIDLSLAEFSTWPKLYEFRARRPVTNDSWTNEREVLMKPDGFIRIHDQTAEGVAEHCFFLEIDRGTETIATVTSKALGYRHYYQSGGFAERMGGDSTDPAAYPFRVLMVVRSVERRDNVAKAMLAQQPPIRSHVWLTTMREIASDTLGAVFVQPQGYVHPNTNDGHQPPASALIEH